MYLFITCYYLEGGTSMLPEIDTPEYKKFMKCILSKGNKGLGLPAIATLIFKRNKRSFKEELRLFTSIK